MIEIVTLKKHIIYRNLTQSYTLTIHFLQYDFFFSALCRDVRLLILEYSRWSMIDKYRALMDGLSLESLLSFVREFKAQLFVEGLVQGNVTSTVSVRVLLVQARYECCSALWTSVSSSLKGKLSFWQASIVTVCLEGKLALSVLDKTFL